MFLVKYFLFTEHKGNQRTHETTLWPLQESQEINSQVCKYKHDDTVRGFPMRLFIMYLCWHQHSTYYIFKIRIDLEEHLFYYCKICTPSLNNLDHWSFFLCTSFHPSSQNEEISVKLSPVILVSHRVSVSVAA